MLLRAGYRQTVGCGVLASAMTTPIFKLYYQVIVAGLIRVVYHNLGFIQLASLLERVVNVASHVASDNAELRAKLPSGHQISFWEFRPKRFPQNLPENPLISIIF